MPRTCLPSAPPGKGRPRSCGTAHGQPGYPGPAGADLLQYQPPEQEFSAQTGKISRVASYDRNTRSWYTWIPLDCAEQAAEMLTTLFETARLHGATIQVLAQPAGESSQSGQAP